jgi:hypothetical protein
MAKRFEEEVWIAAQQDQFGRPDLDEGELTRGPTPEAAADKMIKSNQLCEGSAFVVFKLPTEVIEFYVMTKAVRSKPKE